MQDSKVVLGIILIALLMLILLPGVSRALEDSARIFNTKCAACHGTDGMANTPMGKKMEIPSFASDRIRKLPAAEIQNVILSGGKEKRASHSFGSKGISNEDGAKLAAYVKELGKKR